MNKIDDTTNGDCHLFNSVEQNGLVDKLISEHPFFIIVCKLDSAITCVSPNKMCVEGIHVYNCEQPVHR